MVMVIVIVLEFRYAPRYLHLGPDIGSMLYSLRHIAPQTRIGARSTDQGWLRGKAQCPSPGYAPVSMSRASLEVHCLVSQRRLISSKQRRRIISRKLIDDFETNGSGCTFY
jgi:hypothetical protein